MSFSTAERKIPEVNDVIAKKLREEFTAKKIVVINLFSSPGSGKTSLIEIMAKHVKKDFRIAAIVGDLQTYTDSERINAAGIPAVQIVTNDTYQLDAAQINKAYKKLKETGFNLLVIENISNLFYPPLIDLGEDIKIVMVSTTEGDDKPLKYPVAFRNSSALIINKIDLLPYLNSSLQVLKNNAYKINSNLITFEVSCQNGEGIQEFIDWVQYRILIK